MTSREEIYARVVSTVADALNLDEEEVTLDSTLQGDLGAESIDFLDIVYRLEREFAMKIPRGELFPESIFQGDPEYVDRNGQVTDKGMKELRDKMPFVDLDGFAKNPDVTNLSDLYTVEAICKYVQGKLGNA